MDKLESMKVFSSVARLGSFSAAAQALGISRAMASKHIKNLENDLAVRLFNRTTRHLSLTEAGMNYQERVTAILSEIDETELAITQLNSEPRGILKILAQPSFGAFHLSRVIAAYKKKYPDVAVDMTLTDKVSDLAGSGMDLAIHVGELGDSSLVARKLASARSVVCGAPEYLQEYGIPAMPADLIKHNCLIYKPRIPLNEWAFIVNNAPYRQQVSGSFKSNVGDALRVAAIKGCGLIQLPNYMVGLDIQSGRLQPVLEKFEPPDRPIYAVYSHRSFLSAKIRTFVDFIYALLHPIPYWDEWTRRGEDKSEKGGG
ncbi:MAG: LysR family transcriptional regulator [Gammaproteobacteria bacterium]